MTTPTTNPIPSNTAIDVRFNAEKLDEIINSDDSTFTDRFGNKRLTNKGLQELAASLGQQFSTTLGEYNGFNMIGKVKSFGDLRAIKPVAEGEQILLNGWNEGSSLGGGIFIGRLGTKADDGGTIAAGDGYYWERLIDNDRITPQFFGVLGNGDGSSNYDDTANLQKALNYLGAKGGVLYWPAGNYTLKTGEITATLTKNVGFLFEDGAYLYVVNGQMNCFNVNTGNNTFTIKGQGVVQARFFSAANGSVFNITGAGLRRHLQVKDITVEQVGTFPFGKVFVMDNVNDTDFDSVHINANYPLIFNKTFSGSSRNSMSHSIRHCDFYAAIDAITFNNSYYTAIEGIKIVDCDLLADRGVVINSDASTMTYLPPQLQLTGVHINARQLIVAQGISQVTLEGCLLYTKFNNTSKANGSMEFYGVQGIVMTGNQFFFNGSSGSSVATDAPNLIYLAPWSRSGTAIPCAYVTFDTNLIWNDAYAAPVFSLSGADALAGVINVGGDNIKQAASPWIDKSLWPNKVDIKTNYRMRNEEAAHGLGSYTFEESTGVLTVNGSGVADYISVGLAAGTTINQIKATGFISKFITLAFSNAVNISHNVNLGLTGSRGITVDAPSRMTFRIINSSQCYEVSRSAYYNRAELLRQVTTLPTSATSAGTKNTVAYSTDGKYMYVCYDTNKWMCVQALTTWPS